MNYWLVKSEPSVYSYSDLKRDGKSGWEGVRNYAARNNLRLMKKGDLVLYYHSNEDKAVVGIAIVAKEFYPDPTADIDAWVSVDLKPKKAFKKPITLEQIKKDPRLVKMPLIKNSRLSVMPVSAIEFDHICLLGE